MTDILFYVNNASEPNPGGVSITGILDRERESTYTINIQVHNLKEHRTFKFKLTNVIYVDNCSLMIVTDVSMQAWRTNAAGEVRSAVSLVSVVITVADVNDNSPMLVNSPPTSITLQEVWHGSYDSVASTVKFCHGRRVTINSVNVWFLLVAFLL